VESAAFQFDEEQHALQANVTQQSRAGANSSESGGRDAQGFNLGSNLESGL
jgi:hypothetical protein